MALEEYFGLIGLGLPVGLLLLGLFLGPERAKIRHSVTNYCLAFGGVSVVFGGVAALTHIEFIATKGTLGMLFIGLPAFPAGLMLLLFGGSTASESKGNGQA